MTTYIVMRGDTMWRIARNHALELKELLAANPQITNPSLIFPGQIINIPSTNNSTYTVNKGDNMWDIAASQGIKLSDLKNENPQIKNANLIFPGQIINIPGISNIPNNTGISNVPNTPDTSNVSSDIKSLENEVIRLVNAQRAKAGRAALTGNNEISDVARMKSEDFIKNNYFSHNSPTYGSPFDMLRSFGISFNAAGENIASGQRSAAETMQFWMNSSGHRDNILNSAYDQIGVGVARDSNGNLYWTQMFVGK